MIIHYRDKDFLCKFEKIVMMGGNVDNTKGNTPNKVSEWNFYADPYAAKYVFEAKNNKNIYMFGLESGK